MRCLLLIALMSCAAAHKCIHDSPAVQRQIPVAPVVAQSRRRFQPQTGVPRPMKFAFSWLDLFDDSKYCTAAGQNKPSFEGAAMTRSCDSEDVLTAEKRDYLIKTILPRAAERLSHRLMLVPQSESLKVTDNCFAEVTIPSNVTAGGDGVDADYLLAITAGETEATTLAWAKPCTSVTVNGRPAFGHANFGPANIDTDPVQLSAQVDVAAHEILHAMGFSSNYISSLLKVKSVQMSGRDKEVRVVESPKVLELYRKFVDCADAPGPEIEDEGSSASAGSHWDSRILLNDLMAAAGGSRLTELTLAAFEDFGWGYTVNYSKAEYTEFGRGAGCGFQTLKCNTESGGKDRYWCFTKSTEATQGCTVDHDSVGACNAQEHASALPSNFQYFPESSSIGGPQFSDRCPYVKGFRDMLCANTSRDTAEPMKQVGYFFGEGSMCFESEGVISTVLSIGKLLTDTGRCLRTRCHNKYLQFMVGEGDPKILSTNTAGWLTCPTATATVRHLPGFRGSIKCFSYRHVCPEASGEEAPAGHSEGLIRGTLKFTGASWKDINSDVEKKKWLEQAIRIDISVLLEVSLSATVLSNWIVTDDGTLTMDYRVDVSTTPGDVELAFAKAINGGGKTWMPTVVKAYDEHASGSDIDGAALVEGTAEQAYNPCGRVAISGRRLLVSDTVCYVIIGGVALVGIFYIILCACLCYRCCCTGGGDSAPRRGRGKPRRDGNDVGDF